MEPGMQLHRRSPGLGKALVVQAVQAGTIQGIRMASSLSALLALWRPTVPSVASLHTHASRSRA